MKMELSETTKKVADDIQQEARNRIRCLEYLGKKPDMKDMLIANIDIEEAFELAEEALEEKGNQ